MAPWFDRPLSVAGRVVVRRDGSLKEELVNIDRDLVMIPSLAIHMNREANKGVSYNPQKDLLPLLGCGDSKPELLNIIAEELKVSTEDILAHDELTILAESEEAGVFLLMNQDGSQIFVMGHPEYDRMTLDTEYKRDKAKDLPIHIPANYYPNDDDSKRPLLQWRSHGNIMYANWLNYYVYQQTPYQFIDVAEIIGK